MNYLKEPSENLKATLVSVGLCFFENYECINVTYEAVAVFYSLSSSYHFNFIPFYPSNYKDSRTKAQLFEQCLSALGLLGVDGFEIIDKDGNIVTDEWEKEAI